MDRTTADREFQRDDMARARHWQWWVDIADVMYPSRDFLRLRERRHEFVIYDDSPMTFRRELASAMSAMAFPRDARWAIGRVEPDRDGALNAREDVRAWATDRIERLMTLLYSTRTGFMLSVGQSHNDAVAFGQGWRMLDVRPDRMGLRSRAFSPADVWASRHEGQVTFQVMLTRDEAAALDYPMSDDMRRSQDTQREWTYLHRIVPSESRRWRYDLWVWAKEDRADPVMRGHYGSWPIQRPLFDIAAGDIYATGPGWDALPSARSLQQMGKTFIMAGQFAVEPPLTAPTDSIASPIRYAPGEVAFYDAQALADYGLSDPIRPLQFGRIPDGVDRMIDATRATLMRIFRLDALRLPERDRMTAAEVATHRATMVNALGDVFDRLEYYDVIPLLERAEEIAERMRVLPAPPRALEGRSFRFSYWSPISFARRMSEIAGLARSLELMGAIVAYEPSAAQVLNGDEAMRMIAEPWSWSTRILRSSDALAEMRDQLAQQQQMAQAAEMAKIGADVAAKTAAANRAQQVPA